MYGCSGDGGENWDGKDGSEISRRGEGRLLSFLYADDLAFCGKY